MVTNQLVHRAGISEVPLPVRTDERQDHPRDEVSGLLEVHAVSDPARRAFALEVRQQERGDVVQRSFLLGGQQRQDPFGLGDQDLLEHLVLVHRGVGEGEPALDHRREVGRGHHLFREPQEETVHLPADCGAQQLFLASGEHAVHGGARDARLLHNIFDGGLRDTETRHAFVRCRQHPIPQRRFRL